MTLKEIKAIATTEYLNIILSVFLDNRQAVEKKYWLTMIKQQVSKYEIQ